MLINGEEYSFKNVRENPFKIYGLYKPNEAGPFKRMPAEIADTVSNEVKGLNYNTSGGRIRFKTDADRVVIKAIYPSVGYRACMAPLGASGFDLYEDIEGKHIYAGGFAPNDGNKVGELTYAGIIRTNFRGQRNITVNMPLYDCVSDVEIAVPDGSVVLPADDYECDKRVVFLGSSITQGSSASHPGLSYENIVSRRLNCDYQNFGWSGACKCEEPMIKYLESYPMDAFVFDYDHNAPTSDYLRETHLPVYKRMRAAHPDIPIVLMSRPDYKDFVKEDVLRRIIVQKTYAYGVEHGDDNLFYIDGASFTDLYNRYDFMCDSIHPGDVGMNSMGDKVANILEYAFVFHKNRIK